MNDVKGMDILKKLGFGTMRLPVDENEDINYELIGQMVDIFWYCMPQLSQYNL